MIAHAPIDFENTEVAFADRSDSELKWDHRFFKLIRNQSLVSVGSGLAEFALKIGLPISPVFKYTVFNHFVGGETLQDCETTIRRLAARGVDCLINFGVEAEDSEEDYEATFNENYLALDYASSHANVKAVCIKMTGIGRFGLFEAIQSGKSLSAREKEEFNRVKRRLNDLCQVAVESGTALYIDAEEYWIQNVLDELVLEAMRTYNRERCLIFDTMQFYRHDQLDYLRRTIELAKKNGFLLGTKLVRGAYMEKERERAERLGYPSPIQATKADTDRDYNAAIDLCLENIEHVAICMATHNEKSCRHLVEQIERIGLPKDHPHIQISQLYGMGDHITFNLALQGFNATKYLPYGPVKNIIPYLIRRAEENSSIEGQMGRELFLIKKELERRANQ